MPLFSIGEYETRISNVRADMRARGLDFMLAAEPSNMYYLTAYDGWSFYTPQCVIVAAAADQPTWWWGRGIDRNGARRTAWLPDEQLIGYHDDYVHNPPAHPMQHLAEVLTDLGAQHGKRIGYESDSFYFTPMALAVLQRHLPQAQWVDADGLVNHCRAVKSAAEIACMRHAARIAEKMQQAALETAAVGTPKTHIAAAIYRAGIIGTADASGDYAAMAPILPAGADASAPHLTWDEKPLRANEGIFFELAGCYRRYHCPLARTVYLGEPPDEWRRAEAALIEGIAAGLAAAKVGNVCGDVARALRQTLNKHGFDKAGRCGYSIGIAYPPDWGERTMSFRPQDETPFAAGMTFHFMPGLWMDSWGIEITESILITDTGCETLADFPRRLLTK